MSGLTEKGFGNLVEVVDRAITDKKFTIESETEEPLFKKRVGSIGNPVPKVKITEVK